LILGGDKSKELPWGVIAELPWREEDFG